MPGAPTSEEIREEAEGMYMAEHSEEGYGQANRPEVSELREGGYWNDARDKLMREHGAEYRERYARAHPASKMQHTEPEPKAEEKREGLHDGARVKAAIGRAGQKVRGHVGGYLERRREERKEEHTSYRSGRRRGAYERGVREGRGSPSRSHFPAHEHGPSGAPDIFEMPKGGEFDAGGLEKSLGFGGGRGPKAEDFGFGGKASMGSWGAPPSAGMFEPKRGRVSGIEMGGMAAGFDEDNLGMGKRRGKRSPFEL